MALNWNWDNKMAKSGDGLWITDYATLAVKAEINTESEEK